MLYRFFGRTGSGKTLCSLDKVVNSNYENILILLLENNKDIVLEKLESYKKNTNKIIVNNISLKEIHEQVNDSELELILDETVGKYDCIVIDNLMCVSCEDGACVINQSVFYDDLSKKLAKFSVNNDIDILTSQGMIFDSSKSFDEAMAEFNDLDLYDNQEYVLVYKSYTNDGKSFVKTYEKRNNLIRSVNLNHFFKKDEVI